MNVAGSGSGGDSSGGNLGDLTSGSFNNQKNSIAHERDPFFLHGADHPGLIFVSHPLTGGGNFLPWGSSMIIALEAKNKMQFVDGTLSKPEINSEMYVVWKKVDRTVLSWILNALSKELSETFVYATSAKRVWDGISSSYGQNNDPMKYKLKREIGTLSQGNTSVVDYFNKLIKLWDELSCVAPPMVAEGDWEGYWRKSVWMTKLFSF